VSTVSRRG